MFESESEDGQEGQSNPFMVPAKVGDLQSPSESMHQTLFVIDSSKRFIREVRAVWGMRWVWLSKWGIVSLNIVLLFLY